MPAAIVTTLIFNNMSSSSSSNRVSRLPDVLSLIFAHAVLLERDATLRTGRCTLACAARASKALLEPATRALWRHIDTPRPLVKLFSCAEPVLHEPRGDPVFDYPDDEIEMDAEYSWVSVRNRFSGAGRKCT